MMAPPPTVETFCAGFCRKHRCPEHEFVRRVFRRVIYPQAWLVVLFGGHRADRFSADRETINVCGRLTSLAQIDQELAEFACFRNHGFLRRHCRFRVSGRRLRKLASAYLSG